MGGETKSVGFPQWLQSLVIGRKPIWTLVRLAVLILGTLFVFNYVLTLPIRVTGISMQPTFHDGQINFINRLAYLRHEPRRGDVVGIRYTGDHRMLLKRVVGLPQESVSFVRGKLHINGELVEEPYVKLPCHWNMPPKQLGFDEYYVVGDNRSMAIEGHDQGAAPRQKIVGRVLFGGSS